jgi:hypothetical protein
MFFLMLVSSFFLHYNFDDCNDRCMLLEIDYDDNIIFEWSRVEINEKGIQQQQQ